MSATAAIRQRLEELRRRVAAACERARRDPREVTLVAVSKRQPLERIEAAVEAGQTVFGENHVQEAEGKIPRLPPHLEWHLIGPLQSNKVKRAVRLFRVIHSVDRLKIARLLDREAAALGRRLPVFLEVHLGAEPSKHGFAPAELAGVVGPLGQLAHLEVVGLMAIPPVADAPEASRPWFRQLRSLGDGFARAAAGGYRGWLSMGMSQDFEVAIEEGATHVRVGTALFGPRP